MQLTHAETILLNNTFKIIGQNIHKARMKRKFTLKKLSRLTGFNTETIDHFEMGRTKFGITELMKIAFALEVKPDSLLK